MNVHHSFFLHATLLFQRLSKYSLRIMQTPLPSSSTCTSIRSLSTRPLLLPLHFFRMNLAFRVLCYRSISILRMLSFFSQLPMEHPMCIYVQGLRCRSTLCRHSMNWMSSSLYTSTQSILASISTWLRNLKSETHSLSLHSSVMHPTKRISMHPSFFCYY